MVHKSKKIYCSFGIFFHPKCTLPEKVWEPPKKPQQVFPETVTRRHTLVSFNLFLHFFNKFPGYAPKYRPSCLNLWKHPEKGRKIKTTPYKNVLMFFFLRPFKYASSSLPVFQRHLSSFGDSAEVNRAVGSECMQLCEWVSVFEPCYLCCAALHPGLRLTWLTCTATCPGCHQQRTPLGSSGCVTVCTSVWLYMCVWTCCGRK